MSFILDALKKSEVDRQRKSVPGLMDAPLLRRHPRFPLWAIALGALLAINLIVLAFVLTRGSATPTAAVAVAVQQHKDPAPPVGADHFSPLDNTPVYAPEIPVAEAPPTARTPIVSARPSLVNPAAHTNHRADPVLNEQDTKTDNDEVLPTISELNLTGGEALPELHLDVHVYGTKPSERFVYINMRKYHEGNTLPEGPVVERIRRDGVVLSYHGLRFLLPRQA